MCESDLIDVELMDFSDDQTWLFIDPNDSGQKVDIVDWSLSLDWPVYEDQEFQNTEKEINDILDTILKNQIQSMPDKYKFDSRTYVRPKRRAQRPSINSIVEPTSPTSPKESFNLNQSQNKYMTYNKYSAPLGPILRLKTFNVDGNTENSNAVKEFAMKRKSLVQDEDPQLEDTDTTLTMEGDGDQLPTKPINIDFSQPAHNLHNTFNKGVILSNRQRDSLNMYQSYESLMRMSPPSLESSSLMESSLMERSENFNAESLDSRKSHNMLSGQPSLGRESIDPMMTSMTLSILDEKDMRTSFLDEKEMRTSFLDNSLMGTSPPSLVSSVNSSYIVSNTPKHGRDSQAKSTENNVFSSTTFTHLEQSGRLLSARPRCNQLYNSFTKRESVKNSESYTKAREEACQIDSVKILNENADKFTPKDDMTETVTLHYSNSKFRADDAEKENVDASFQKEDTFYKDMGIIKSPELAKNSLNVTLNKQELNEIIQARQKLSLARKALPTDPTPLPNQVESSPCKDLANASELLARKKAYANGFEKGEGPIREPPKRNATFKKASPRASSMDTTVVFVNDNKPTDCIDINSATTNLVDGDRTMQHEEWGSQERAMVGSSDSTDTGTFSSSSPPDSVPESMALKDPHGHIASTPITSARRLRPTAMNLHPTISPIYNMVDDTSYTVTKVPSTATDSKTVVNTNTIVRKPAAKSMLATKMNVVTKPMGMPVKTISADSNLIPSAPMAPPAGIPRKSALPTSKLRQYSSHKDLRLLNNNAPATSGLMGPRAGAGRAMVRRTVYASNPILSPTSSHSAYPTNPTPPIRRDSYTIALNQDLQDIAEPGESSAPAPVATAPPPLVRQGTETLRPRAPSQIQPPKDLRGTGPSSLASPASVRNHYMPPPTQRPYSIAGTASMRPLPRPVPTYNLPKHNSAPASAETRPASDTRASGLPRPSRLPAPRRTLRPTSAYSVAPTADDHY